MTTHSTDGATGVNALRFFLDGLSETINRNVYNAEEVSKLVGSMFRTFEHSESESAWQELASDKEFCEDWKAFSTKFNELSSNHGDSFGDDSESKELKCYVDSLRSTIASKFTREPI